MSDERSVKVETVLAITQQEYFALSQQNIMLKAIIQDMEEKAATETEVNEEDASVTV